MSIHSINIADPSGTIITALNYNLKPGAYKQARLQHRFVGMPDIDLGQYEIRAVVDWIEIGFVIVNRSQFQHIQTLVMNVIGRNPFVRPIDPGSGNVANIYQVRLQEPDFEEVQNALREIDDRYLLKSDPVIKAMEVSIDIFSKTHEEEARARMFGVVWRHLMVEPERFLLKDHLPRFVHSTPAITVSIRRH